MNLRSTKSSLQIVTLDETIKEMCRACTANLLAQWKMESMSSSIMSFNYFLTIQMIHFYSFIYSTKLFHCWFNTWRDHLYLTQCTYNHCTEKQAQQRSSHILWICPCNDILYSHQTLIPLIGHKCNCYTGRPNCLIMTAWTTAVIFWFWNLTLSFTV